MWHAGNMRGVVGEEGKGSREEGAREENDSGTRIPEFNSLRSWGSQEPIDSRIQGAADHREYQTREI